MLGRLISGAGEGLITNPFIETEEKDMASYLTSEYEGCFVKYSGPSTRHSFNINKDVDVEYPVQALCLSSLNSVPQFGEGEYITFIKTNDDGSQEKYYLSDADIVQTKKNGVKLYIPQKAYTFVSGQSHNPFLALFKEQYGSGEYSPYSIGIERILYASGGFDERVLATSPSLPFYCSYHSSKWPLTGTAIGKDTFNQQGKCIAWGYDEDITFTLFKDAYHSWNGIEIEQYAQNQIYEVKRRTTGKYYFKPYLDVAQTATTAGAGYVTRDKTFVDMTGVVQKGNGSLISPFLVKDISVLENISTEGVYFRWVGANATLEDGRKLYYGQTYTTSADGDEKDYVLLPTLTNEGTAEDLAKGKQLINSNGEIVVGTLKGAATNKLNQYLNKTLIDVTEDDLAGIINISNGAFASCTKLTNITIPDSVTNIGSDAFSGCSELTTVTMLPTTPPSLGNNAFYGLSSSAQIIVPAGTGDAYRVASGWSTYASKIVEAAE